MRDSAYDGLLAAMLEQLRTLDFSYGRAAGAAEEEGGADPLLGEGLAESNRDEMQRFINLAGGLAPRGRVNGRLHPPLSLAAARAPRCAAMALRKPVPVSPQPSDKSA